MSFVTAVHVVYMCFAAHRHPRRQSLSPVVFQRSCRSSPEGGSDPADEVEGRNEAPAQNFEGGTNEKEPRESQEKGSERSVGALSHNGGFLRPQSADEREWTESWRGRGSFLVVSRVVET